MTRNELKDILVKLTTVYPFKGDRQVLLNEWYDVFKDIKFSTFKQAYDIIKKRERFFPTIAVFNETIIELENLSSDEAWKICKKFLDASMELSEYNRLKKKYPNIHQVYREHKVSLESEYLAKNTFVKRYRESLKEG